MTVRKLTIALVAFIFSACSHPAAVTPRADGGIVAARHWGEKPRTRTAQGSRLLSDSLPNATIVLPDDATYIGSTRFDLKGVGDAEIHLFVEAGKNGVVDRAYWIQFESYLSQFPEYAYDFTEEGYPLATLGEMDLYYRARFGAREDVPPKGSEAERVLKMINDAGYTMPAETFSAQFHQVTSPERRSEILIIFVGNLADIGLGVEEIVEGGKDGEPHKQLTARALPIAQRYIQVDVSQTRAGR